MTVLTILGGIALILYGVRCLRKGLDRIFGQRLHQLTERMVGSRFRALLAGCLFGTMVPSSTTQTVITLQLLQSGKLPIDRMLAFLAGSTVGITVLVQLIALRIFDYYVAFIATGIALFLFTRWEPLRGTGQSLLGGGFIFLAISLISQSGRDISASPDMVLALELLQHHPVVLLAATTVLTVILQSSTAVIGLTIGLAEGSAVGNTFLFITVIGANMGLALTTLIAAWSTLTGKMLAMTNLMLKWLLALALFTLLTTFPETAGPAASPTRMAANLHTGFNLLNALLCLAGAGLLVNLASRMMPASPDGLKPDTHLDLAALKTPVIALANAARETMGLLDKVRRMYHTTSHAIENKDPGPVKGIKKEEDEVDAIQAAIKNYLSSIDASEINPNDSRLQFGLLHFTAQLEEIADIIDRGLQPAAEKIAAHAVALDPSDSESLRQAARKIDEAFIQAIAVLTTRDRQQAKILLKEQDRFKPWVIQEEIRHYRILSQKRDYLSASSAYLSFLHGSRRISGLLKSIGHTFLIERNEI